MLAVGHAYLTCAQLVTRRQAVWMALGIKRAAWAAVRCCLGAGSPVCGTLLSSLAHVTDAQRRMRLAVKTASEKAGLDSLSSVRTHGSQSLRHRPAGPADVAKAQLVVVRCVAGSGRLAQLGLAAELRAHALSAERWRRCASELMQYPCLCARKQAIDHAYCFTPKACLRRLSWCLWRFNFASDRARPRSA